MSDQVSGNGSTQPKGAGRGVSYPFISLGEAIERAQVFHREERKSAAPVTAAMRHFGYSESSSGGRQTISALIQFGLLEDEGRSESRQVKLTDRALTILLDEPHSIERLVALRECVRLPKLYANILARWPNDLPSDHSLSFYLQKEFDFNPKNLKAFIADFRSSLALAKYQQDVGVEADREDWSDPNLNESGSPAPESADVGRVGSGAAVALPAAPISRQPYVSVQTESGEREWLRGPLSKDVSYRLIVNGDVGPKEIGKLIKLLQAQKAVLDDDDEDEL